MKEEFNRIDNLQGYGDSAQEPTGVVNSEYGEGSLPTGQVNAEYGESPSPADEIDETNGNLEKPSE